MAATLTPTRCACGQLVGYSLRAGEEHHSAEDRDPYEVSGTISMVDGQWVIGPLSGRLYPAFVGELRAALRAVGIARVGWERASGKQIIEEV